MNAAPPRVSVVMPMYNAARFLREAVDSILHQTLAELELIVIDDGSTDDSVAIIEALTDERIRLVRNPRNGGPARCRNIGIEEARALYVALMDADDVAHPDRLRQQWEYLEKNPRVAALGTSFLEIGEHGEPGAHRRFPCGSERLQRLLAGENPFGNSTLMFRRAALLEVGGYRPLFRAAEDYDLMLRLGEKFELANLSACLLRYRVHSASLSNAKAHTEVVCVRVARESARRRRSGQVDPCAGNTELTPDLLRALGISATDLEFCKVEAYRSRIGRMVSAGDLSLAQRILLEYEGDTIDADVRERAAPDIEVLRIWLLWAQRHHARAFLMLLARCGSSVRMCVTVVTKAWWLAGRGLRSALY